MDAYRALVDKRDQRAFLPKPIPDESPRRAMGDMGPWARWLADAAAIVVIVQTERHEFDAGRCAQNTMVAAWADGIGSCPAHLPEAELGRLLGVPAELHVNRVIGFGYVDPARTAPPRSVARPRKPLTELVHFHCW